MVTKQPNIELIR